MRSIRKLVLANVICLTALLTLGLGAGAAGPFGDDPEYNGCCREQAAGPELYRYCCAATGPGSCNCGGIEEWCNFSEECNEPE